MTVKSVLFLAGNLLLLDCSAADLKITAFTKDGSLTLTNSFPQGVVTVVSSPTVTAPWKPLKSAFSVSTETQVRFAPPEGTAFFRGVAVDLTGGPWEFDTNDFSDLGSLAEKLTTSYDDVAIFIWNQLSPHTQDLLNSYSIVPDSEILAALAPDLNAILHGPSIYDADRFWDVSLSLTTQELLSENPQGSALIRLNRMLLDDAYPEELVGHPDASFPNLVESFSNLSTIAGSNGVRCISCNNWQPEYEGALATNTVLSSPHIAMADRAGNIYIADKRAHGIRKIKPDGTLVTVAGINVAGYGSTNPAPATTVALKNPNGIWVRADGTFYILDRDNGLIRKVDTNGIMTALVDHGAPIDGGRGLWVSDDESLLFYSAGSRLMSWDSTNGLYVAMSGFSDLGNIAFDPNGQLVVTDLNFSQVFRIETNGTKTIIAGNGHVDGGGDGQLATATGLYGVRGVWFLPTGGYFLTTDTGSQLWYVDPAGFIHLLLNGAYGVHDGDGAWVYDNPTATKMGAGKGVTMDYEGNLLITENEIGYIRKVQFLRHEP